MRKQKRVIVHEEIVLIRIVILGLIDKASITNIVNSRNGNPLYATVQTFQVLHKQTHYHA